MYSQELLPHHLDQFQELSLTHHRVGEIEPCKLDLLRMENLQLLDVPVIERTVIFKFERANRMRDLLDRIGLTVGEIVHRVNAPLIPGAMVMGA